jgi:hypothetical protein
MSLAEAQVVRWLKRHLLDRGLAGVVPGRILVDSDPSYIHSPYARELEPMARVEVGGGRPDLLCSAARTEGSLVTGFEVKAATRDWMQGLAQARRYRAGVHHSYLAIPGRPTELEREAGPMARETGVGILALSNNAWHEVTRPAEPIPLPWSLGRTTAALDGVPVARQLQLNHPLNYLVVPLLAATLPAGRGLLEELEVRWPDLGSAGTRKHAIVGAASLRLIDTNLDPTAEGLAVADLMLALGFAPETRPSKRARLVDVAPALAAVARFVLLQQPAVQLVLRVLLKAGCPVDLPRLAHDSILRDPSLGSALFLSDPSIEVHPGLPGTAYNPTTVFKLKQNLWHAGLLATKFHATAGGKATRYTPKEDFWALEEVRVLGHLAGGT